MSRLAGSWARPALGRMAAAMLTLGLVPLALLTYFSVTLASSAVERQVEDRLRVTTNLSASLVETELTTLGQLVEAYAQRPHLVESVTRDDRRGMDLHLRELRRARAGIYTTFLARPNGRLVAIVPATPSIVGDDFSFRDWYRGVSASGATYISEAYRTQAAGTPLVVAAAAPVTRDGRRIGILVAAYSVAHLDRFAERIARAQRVIEKITDQRGTIVAAGGGEASAGDSASDDPRVAAALAGRSGLIELDTADGRRLSAYTPVRGLGWTVTTSVPSDVAFAAVERLRVTVLAIASLLSLLLLLGIALLARALRARARAEETANRQARINAAVLEATADGIALVGGDGRIAVANASFERTVSEMIGEPAELVGRKREMREIAQLIAERTTDPERYRRAFAHVADDPAYVGVDEYELAESGRSFQRYTAPVHDEAGTLIGRILVLRETTAEREAERLKVELLATVSHELRTPLTGILGFAELLVRQDVDAETRALYLNTIHGEAKRLTMLINDFLDLQRIEEGHFRLALEPFDLREVLEHEVRLFSGQGDSHTIELTQPDEPLVVVGERERIAQVLANLLSNAIKYSPAGGNVSVRAERRNGVVRVFVSDSGVGIPADQQLKLFTKFFRVDSSDTREIGGTGLGLALSRQIVEAHAGRIGFESVEGAGSTFWFELPSGERSDDDGGRRILVVEDDAATAALLGAHLARAQLEVEVVQTGEEALARAVADPPAAVCLDITLPGDVDGWQVLARLKANPTTEGVPVVVCTGGNGRGRAAALGAADFVAKPFSADRLEETVRRILPDRHGQILVVDDEPTVRRLVTETLANGFVVREAADGEEALAAVARERPDAIVLDLMMPKLDGFEVLERLQQDPLTRMIPVVVLTARQLSPDDRELLCARAVSLLDKSLYSPQELVRLVEQAVGGRSGSAPAAVT